MLPSIVANIIIVIILGLPGNVFSENEEGKVEDWKSDFEWDEPAPIRDPNEIASILATIHSNLKLFAEIIPTENWAHIQDIFRHKLDKPSLIKFIDGTHFTLKYSEKNQLRQMHEGIRYAQIEFKKILWKEAKNENRAKLARMTEITLELFKPRNSEDAIQCYSPVYGFEGVEIDTNEYKVIRNVLTIGDFLHEFVNITASFPDTEWERKFKNGLNDPFEVIYLREKKESGQKREEDGLEDGRLIQVGPYEMRFHFWRCLKRFEEFEVNFWDYIQFYHPLLEGFLANAKGLVEAVTKVLSMGVGRKEEIVEPTNAFLQKYFEPNEEQMKKCLYKILWLRSLNYRAPEPQQKGGY